MEETNSLADLTITELKEVCRSYRLPVSGAKEVLLQRLVPFIEALANFDDGDEIASFEES